MTTAQIQYEMKDMKELNPNWKEVFPLEQFRAETFGAESKKKGYEGWINETTSYRRGGSTGTYNIFENDKYRTSVGVNDFKKMVIAESRFKKDWKDVVLDADRRVWPQTYDKKHPAKFVKLPFSDYTWRYGDVAKKNAETFGAESKKTKYGMIAAGIITAFALLPEIKKRF